MPERFNNLVAIGQFDRGRRGAIGPHLKRGEVAIEIFADAVEVAVGIDFEFADAVVDKKVVVAGFDGEVMGLINRDLPHHRGGDLGVRDLDDDRGAIGCP